MSRHPSRRSWSPERLGLRLALLLSVALLPVGLIAVLQAVSLLKEAKARSEAALMGETLMSVQSELRLIQRGQGMAAALANRLSSETGILGADNQEDGQSGEDAANSCRIELPLLSSQLAEQAQIAVVGSGGEIICASATMRDNMAGTILLQDLMESDGPEVMLDNNGILASGSAILINHPITGAKPRDDAPAEIIGAVSVILPHMALREISGLPEDRMLLSLPQEQGAAILTFNEKGEVLTSSAGLESAQGILPRHRALKALVGSRPLAFTAVSELGIERVYSVIPLIEENLYALGTWPGEGHRIQALDTVPAALFPALMWGASLIVAWLAAGRMVTRHIYKLRGAIGAFAGGDRVVREIDVSGAPIELRQLSDSFVRMTDTILHDEAELENAVHQKEVLLREVHHRVKNNLQLIASILNMQIRQARSPEAKGLMTGVRDRVMSLATIHRGLYQTSGLTDISADELLSDILRQLTHMATGPGRPIEIEQDFDPVRLTPDQAVPLSLCLTQALTNAIKYAGNDGDGPPHLSVSLKRMEEDAALLCVVNSTGTRPDNDTEIESGTGLGVQLLDAFAQQIGGQVSREEKDGRFALAMGFKLTPLTEAEARNAPEETDDSLIDNCL